MVRAILDGRKTQTRRAIKQCKPAGDLASEQQEDLELRGWDFYEGIWFPKCSYGRPGDRLWVRETWCQVDDREYGGKLWYDYRATPKYNASHPAGWDNEPESPEALKWRPSIYMPRAASRITLEITAIRVERLQDISPEDARAEGIFQTAYYDDWLWSYRECENPEQYASPEAAYQGLWEVDQRQGIVGR